MESSAQTLSLLVNSVADLSEAQLQINAKVDKLIESMGKQEVILEKLANIEKTNAEAVKRLHKRIDTNEENIKTIAKEQREGSPYVKNLWEKRNLQIDRIEEILEDRGTLIGINKRRLDDIESIPNKLLMRFFIVGVGLIAAAIFGGHLFFK